MFVVPFRGETGPTFKIPTEEDCNADGKVEFWSRVCEGWIPGKAEYLGVGRIWRPSLRCQPSSTLIEIAERSFKKRVAEVEALMVASEA